jgi:hypothetical protein
MIGRIKKHSNGNYYLLTKEGLWIRDFTRNAPHIDINNLTKSSDYHSLIENHIKNVVKKDILYIDTELKRSQNIVIVSDGYRFEQHQELLDGLPSNVLILAVNRSLARWNVKQKRGINYYVVNNPYPECKSYLPHRHKYFPSCIASVRTHPEFIRHYRNQTILRYVPTPEEGFVSLDTHSRDFIDDYRNPICAAIGIAYKMGVVNLLLFCCDDAFEDARPGADKLKNGLYSYPQHRTSHSLIEGNLYWLANQDGKRINIGNFSHGLEYEFVPYINKEEVVSFFSLE